MTESQKRTAFDVRKFTEDMMAQMRGILESGSEAIPIAFRVTHSGNYDVIGIGGMFGEAEKDRVAEMLRSLAEQPDTACVIYLSDSYVKDIDTSKGEHLVSGRLKDEPGRREAISALVSGKGVDPSWARWIYDRDANGRPVFEDKITWSTDPAIGRFVVGGPSATRN